MPDLDRLSELLKGVLEDRDELGALASAIDAYPRPSLRMRRDRRDVGLPWPCEPVPWLDTGLWYPAGEKPSRLLDHYNASFYIQDAGSMLAIAACGNVAGLSVCDLCAAPGGKATALAERLQDSGELLANEPISGRTSVLEFALTRTGTNRWCVSSLDPDRLADELPQEFDLVLVDAPCSGQTLHSRGKQQDAAWSARQVEHSASRQRRIVSAAARLLRPGGKLVYSTCTFAVAENEAIVQWMIDELGFRAAPVPELANYEVSGYSGCYRLWPHRHGCAGAFAASLILESPQQQANSDGATFSASMPRRTSRRKPATANPALIAAVEDWGTLEGVEFQVAGPRLFGWPPDFPATWIAIAQGGPEVGYLTGQTWHPGYALALRAGRGWTPRQTLPIDASSAVGWLQGRELLGSNRGWQVITTDQKPLCWGKCDGRRIKLAAPPALRALANG